MAKYYVPIAFVVYVEEFLRAMFELTSLVTGFTADGQPTMTGIFIEEANHHG